MNGYDSGDKVLIISVSPTLELAGLLAHPVYNDSFGLALKRPAAEPEAELGDRLESGTATVRSGFGKREKYEHLVKTASKCSFQTPKGTSFTPHRVERKICTWLLQCKTKITRDNKPKLLKREPWEYSLQTLRKPEKTWTKSAEREEIVNGLNCRLVRVIVDERTKDDAGVGAVTATDNHTNKGNCALLFIPRFGIKFQKRRKTQNYRNNCNTEVTII
ncbi:hypothetical protein WN51_07031 [Melipona quadrifasciata]|uniref:Uncharacterized protein n=1 Tax=Melipona quadrifasciata TaxID=166423 RepID=A0A0N0BC85_9HYME|nr:hypothetical protein WN51_07031 [Melipona quadrifasciata]